MARRDPSHGIPAQHPVPRTNCAPTAGELLLMSSGAQHPAHGPGRSVHLALGAPCQHLQVGALRRECTGTCPKDPPPHPPRGPRCWHNPTLPNPVPSQGGPAASCCCAQVAGSCARCSVLAAPSLSALLQGRATPLPQRPGCSTFLIQSSLTTAVVLWLPSASPDLIPKPALGPQVGSDPSARAG